MWHMNKSMGILVVLTFQNIINFLMIKLMWENISFPWQWHLGAGSITSFDFPVWYLANINLIVSWIDYFAFLFCEYIISEIAVMLHIL